MTVLQQIITGVKNFLNKVEHKLPTLLVEGAKFGVDLTEKAKTILNGTAEVQIASIIPDGEVVREEAIAILNELEPVFKAVSGDYQNGALFVAASKLAALKVGTDVPMNNVNLAVQAEYTSRKLAA